MSTWEFLGTSGRDKGFFRVILPPGLDPGVYLKSYRYLGEICDVRKKDPFHWYREKPKVKE